MSRKRKYQKRADSAGSSKSSSVGFLLSDEAYRILCGDGYQSLDKNPDIIAAIRAYADVISSMTIQIMANTARGTSASGTSSAGTSTLRPTGT